LISAFCWANFVNRRYEFAGNDADKKKGWTTPI
jgi:hypothetical protein